MFSNILKKLFDPNGDGNTSFGEFFGGVLKIFVGGVIWLWYASLSYDMLTAVFPNNVIGQYVGLIMFDVGILYWLIQFRTGAKGKYQRIISFVMTIFSMIGLFAVIGVEIVIGGQQLVTTIDTVLVGQITLGFVWIWSMGMAIAFVVYELSDEKTLRDIMVRLSEDKIGDQALRNLEEKVQERLPEFAESRAREMFDEVADKYTPTSVHQRDIIHLSKLTPADPTDDLLARRLPPSNGNGERKKQKPPSFR